jgi:cbb3-type cytochrome oxidase subunit 3
METINYPLVIAIVLALAALVVWLIRRNQKDEKDYEKDSNRSEMKPEKGAYKKPRI